MESFLKGYKIDLHVGMLECNLILKIKLKNVD